MGAWPSPSLESDPFWEQKCTGWEEAERGQLMKNIRKGFLFLKNVPLSGARTRGISESSNKV